MFILQKIGFAEAAALGIPYFTAYRAIYILWVLAYIDSDLHEETQFKHIHTYLE